jgi:benzoate/toluate 1,2-dioxygenase alpha subunit
MIPGPDEEAKALGCNPVSSGVNMQDETLYHGQYRRWQELMQGIV